MQPDNPPKRFSAYVTHSCADETLPVKPGRSRLQALAFTAFDAFRPSRWLMPDTKSAELAPTRTRPARSRRVLMIVENLPVPFDRRVWSEAKTLRGAGYLVSVICPKMRGYNASEETIDGIDIYRHPLPLEAHGTAAYFVEYGMALFWEFILSMKVARRQGFDAIHACNPPDLIFLIAALYKLFGRKRFVFDHHDANPELYEAKFGRRNFFWELLVLAEKMTFRLADVSIATNESYREIAITRGKMMPDRVFVVRSGPDADRVKEAPPDPRWRKGRRYSVGYVGVIGQSEGLDLLLRAVDHIVRDRRRGDIQFIVVGDGPERNAILDLCRTMKLEDWVTFTGSVDDATLLSILSTADVCVNPDRVTVMNDISTMNKIMEYMALRKPIVQFEVKEGKISADAASLYAAPNDPIDFADNILRLIDNPDLRKQMGEFGKQRLHDVLEWRHQEPKLLDAYETLFAPNPSR
jgi:glycosyltransferase involved in cell wall biosynthesis